jgi:hypothetical protein
VLEEMWQLPPQSEVGVWMVAVVAARKTSGVRTAMAMALDLQAVVILPPLAAGEDRLGDLLDRQVRELVEVLHPERSAQDEEAPPLALFVGELLDLLAGERLRGDVVSHPERRVVGLGRILDSLRARSPEWVSRYF